MRCFALSLTLAGAILVLGAPAYGQDPPAQLPAPRVLHAPVVPVPVIETYPGYYRTSYYAIWDYYGVNRAGRFRPLVVYSPYGAYYRYNGRPFPWTQEHQGEIMPYIVDSPP
jgi:hypothetical protein